MKQGDRLVGKFRLPAEYVGRIGERIALRTLHDAGYDVYPYWLWEHRQIDSPTIAKDEDHDIGELKYKRDDRSQVLAKKLRRIKEEIGKKYRYSCQGVDLIAFKNGDVYLIEVKVNEGELLAPQMEFMERASKELGVNTFILHFSVSELEYSATASSTIT